MSEAPYEDLGAPHATGASPLAPRRPPYRPPIGIPIERPHTVRAAIVSVLIHLAIIALLIVPPLVLTTARFDVDDRGAGGADAAGGGGGGLRGTGGLFEHIIPERLRYVQVAPPAPVTRPAPTPVVVPPPKVEVPKPKPVVPPPPQPTAEVVRTAVAPSPTIANAASGTGGGTGADGTAGNGTGSGGGIGSGVGPGRGSGSGPGTGGGDAKQYPPTVIALPILPLPVPSKVRPYTLEAVFEVDTLGNARLLAYNPSADGGYNRRIREMLSEIRFRPAVRMNGRPVLDTAKIIAQAP